MKVFLKLVAGMLAKPLLVALILAAAGLAFQRGGRRRFGAGMMFAGAALAYLSSTSLIGNALLWPLECQYPPFEPAQAIAVHDIVVLGSSYDPRDHIPVTGALDADGLARIVEGVRLALARPGSRLMVSGGAAPGLPPIARGYAQMATELGVQQSSLVIMDRALNTKQEAHEIFALLGHAPFILVTSANHMPRAIQLMQHAGANPLAAPTAQRARPPEGSALLGVVPGSGGLHKTETAMHEYLGLAAARLGFD